VGAEYVALSAYDEFQLSSEPHTRTEETLYGFYTEFKECSALQVLPNEFDK
jgi:hypothetical protein